MAPKYKIITMLKEQYKSGEWGVRALCANP